MIENWLLIIHFGGQTFPFECMQSHKHRAASQFVRDGQKGIARCSRAIPREVQAEAIIVPIRLQLE
jgi:hypothetical protein